MKTLKNLAAFLLILASVSAFSRPSNITIRLNSNRTFKLIFDRSVYTRSSSYYLQNVYDGYHEIAVYEEKPGNRHRYGNGERLVFSGRIFVPENKNIEAVVDKRSGYQVVRESLLHPYNHNNQGHNNHDHRGDHGVNNYGNHGYNGDYRQNYGMNEDQFRILLRTIDEKSFNSSKVEIVKTALIHHRVSSRQVLEIARRLTFESAKLDIAKYAYNRTIDPENYFLVNSAFYFASSSEELGRYIRSGRF